MRCRRAVRKIPLLAGNDLSQRRTARLQRHLETCPDCRRELESQRAALEALRAAAREQPVEDWPEPAWKALLAGITAADPGTFPPGLRPSIPRWAFAAGAASLILLAGLLLIIMDKIFRPEEVSPVPGPLIVEKQETPAPPGISPESQRIDSPESEIREKRPSPAVARKSAEESGTPPAGSPEKPGRQDVVSVTLVSQESGLQVVWFFDKNFEWKGDQR